MKDWRIYFIVFLIGAAGFGIAGRMFYLQVVKGGYYAALARGQHTEYLDVEPPRGSIFFQDKYGPRGLFIAATNKEWPLLYAVPGEIEDARAAAVALTLLLHPYEKDSLEELRDSQVTVADFEENLYERFRNQDDPYEPLAHKLDKQVVEDIEALEIAGLYVTGELSRYYPARELGAHILGFVGYAQDERAGQYGAEGFYNDALHGKEGVSEISPLAFGGERKNFVRPGDDLILSIDYNIQYMIEEKLRAAKEALNAERAAAIVMDPKTGEIIAMGEADSFDPNAYSEVAGIDIFLNDAVQKMFEPGSVFKPFTMAVALDTQKLSPTSEYTDKGYVRIGGYTIKNSNEKTYGQKTMTNVLELSINTGAVYMEEAAGHDLFREYIQRFGFGVWTEVDLQGEIPGDIRNVLSTSRDINFATASFGQGIAVTPIQLISAFSAFANGGNIMKPHVVKEIVTAAGDRTVITPVVVGSPISAKTAAQMTSVLVSVVENGYGKKAAVKGYKVAGKTGTAQIPDEGGGYSEDRTIHSFIGYAPAYDPRFVVLIKVENPQGINFASDSIAPLFSEIAEYILHYYAIPPDS